MNASLRRPALDIVGNDRWTGLSCCLKSVNDKAQLRSFFAATMTFTLRTAVGQDSGPPDWPVRFKREPVGVESKVRGGTYRTSAYMGAFMFPAMRSKFNARR